MSSNPTTTDAKKDRPKVPEWLMILFGLLIYFGMLYAHKFGGELDARVYEPYKNWNDVQNHWPETDDPWLAAGRTNFQTYCAPCHQATGLGAPGVAPPLAQSEWVLAEGPERIIRIVLNGLQGPITVKGQEWNSAMLPWRTTLNDEQIAQILTYVRQSPDWEGHDASAVTEERVAEIRSSTESRGAAAWTAAELEQVELSSPE